METVRHVISAKQCRLSSQIVNLGSMIAVLIFPLITLWFAGSIFAYAAVGHHPDLRVREYNRYAGYRFYGFAGTLPVLLIFADELHHLAGGTLKMWLWVWAVGVLTVVPWGIWAWIKSGREEWREIVMEGEKHD